MYLKNSPIPTIPNSIHLIASTKGIAVLLVRTQKKTELHRNKSNKSYFHYFLMLLLCSQCKMRKSILAFYCLSQELSWRHCPALSWVLPLLDFCKLITRFRMFDHINQSFFLISVLGYINRLSKTTPFLWGEVGLI